MSAPAHAPRAKASEIAAFLGRPLVGRDVEVFRAAPAARPEPGALVFLKALSEESLGTVNAQEDLLVLATPEHEGRLKVPHVLTPSPRLDFARALQRFLVPPLQPGVARTAVVAPTARLGPGVRIGEFCVVGEHAVIGEGTELRHHVVVHDRCVIGRRGLIKSHTVIGEEGFGFDFEEDGTPVRIPHLGRVVVGDDVEIGATNVIARGTLDDTVLEDRVKTDDHVFIAHNARIGENTVVIAGAEISGSVRIGRNAWIAPQACIINKVTVGDDAMVGIGAVVTKPVPPNVIVAGNPAKVLRKRYEDRP